VTKKQFSIIAFVLLLGGLSLYLNRDWFASEQIQISHRSLSSQRWFKRKPAGKPATNPVVFLLSRKVKLTAVKVVFVSEIQTNKYAHAVWHLISNSNSVPVREFTYGAPIRGMRYAAKGVPADPLEPGLNYRVLIESDSGKAEHDFVPVPAPR
jgi:hypothetical protein